MWWRSSVFGAALVSLALSLAGCGFQPLYGPTASGSSMPEVMRTVEIEAIPGRVGQKIRNELIFSNTGGAEALPSKYKLDITIRESVTQELVKINGEATGQVYQVDATFKLKSVSDGKIVLQGQALSRAAYDRYEQIFSNVRAQYDAQNRCARTIAESIKARVAAYLQTSV
jgi:LPS-assembly lipoprotein